MLFFQLVLFGGYLYAHLLTNCCTSRQQLLIHLTLLTLAAVNVIWGRLIPPETLRPPGLAGENPLWQVLVLLTVTVGLPYFVLSSSGPLLQRWFHTAAGASPYRLFALSNLGSLLALLSYPFFVEVHWGVVAQALGWSLGYLLFVACCTYCAVVAWRAAKAGPIQSALDELSDTGKTAKSATPGWHEWVIWLLLPALASMLFLAFTNEVCQNVASVPLLWVVPLSVYLLSFIIAFDHPRWYSRVGFSCAVLLMLAIVTHYDWCLEAADALLDRLFPSNGDTRSSLGSLWWLQASCYFLALFAIATLCHGELARARPSPRHLTSYYLTMSFGGALGGLLVNLAAPQLFDTFFEFPLGLFAAAAVAAVLLIIASRDWTNRPGRWAFRWTTLAVSLLVVSGLALDQWPVATTNKRTVYVARNFYGTVDVMHRAIGEPTENYTFYSGNTQHGKQYAAPEQRATPLTYYGAGSGCETAIRYMQSQSPRCRLGVIGLGAGTIATYARPTDSIRFYEINPEVIQIARDTRWFYYLSDCQCTPELVLGDARLQLERELRDEGSQQFDVLVVDAFSADSVPVHLLTREAFGIYLQHLRPGGILALHITNNHLDLYPVASQLADHYGFEQRRIFKPGDPDRLLYRTYYVLISRDAGFLRATSDQIENLPEFLRRPRDVPMWTDDYTNLTSLLR